MSWKIDFAHSHVQFSVRHMMISKVRGMFEIFSGSIALDEADPTRTTVEVQIDTASINTREPNRDNHLRSADFFNTAEFPLMTFKSRHVERTGETSANLVGDLTIRGATRQVTLKVEFEGQAKSPWGTTSVGFTAGGKINRKDWGLTWNQALETGGVLVGDEIDISIELELVREAELVQA